jgi:hypothetical protein
VVTRLPEAQAVTAALALRHQLQDRPLHAAAAVAVPTHRPPLVVRAVEAQAGVKEPEPQPLAVRTLEAALVQAGMSLAQLAALV